MSVQIAPPSALRCQRTVGAGVPVAAAVNVATAPACTLWLAGCVVTTGALVAAVTVSSAGFVAADPAVFVNTARKRVPWSACAVVNAYDTAVAPEMSAHVAPPSVLTCHRTVGAGVPDAAAVNVATAPACTLWLAGCSVTTGAACVGEPTTTVPILTSFVVSVTVLCAATTSS